MKKLSLFLFIALLIVILCACGGKAKKPTATTQPPLSTTTPSAEVTTEGLPTTTPGGEITTPQTSSGTDTTTSAKTPDTTPDTTQTPPTTTKAPLTTAPDTTPNVSTSEETTKKQPASVEPVSDLLYPAFETPDDSMKAKPLWFWNTTLDAMDEETVREIVRKSYQESGYNGFGILPYWQDGYLSDQYFSLYEAALDEGSKYGMEFLLYDENGFPSYTAGGLFAEKYPDLTAKRLDMVESSRVRDGKIFLRIPQGELMGAVAWNEATGEMLNLTDKAVIRKLPEFDISTVPFGASASSTYALQAGYDVDKAFDGNTNTRWNAGSQSGNGSYLQIFYEEAVAVDEIRIYEPDLAQLHRVKAFKVQYYDEANDTWTVAAEGKTITNKGATLSFDSVTARLFRVLFTNISTDSATITELELYAKGAKLPIPKSKPIEKEDTEMGWFSSSDYSSGYTAEKAFDESYSTRWNAARDMMKDQWISVHFGREVTVDSVKVTEAFDRITAFSIQYLDGTSWKTCVSGTTIGEAGKSLTFTPVKTRAMRLYIHSANAIPSIYEMECYNEGELVALEVNNETYKGSYLEHPVSGDGWKLMAFVLVKEQTIGMDYLSEEAVAGFIEITYDAYYARFKKYFDNGTIIGAFFDEPSFFPNGSTYGVAGARMWTGDFNEVFAQTYGKEIDPVLYYPAMWYDIGEKTTEARDRLNAIRTEMFAKHYVGQINEWCEKHGIDLYGHMLLEDVDNPVCYEGDLMYSFKYQSVPSVDTISYYRMSEKHYKIVSSSAYNWDKGLVGVEAYGAYGADMPVSVLYKGAMDLYARGINVMVPHAVWYDGVNNIPYPPELSYRNPKYAFELKQYNDFIGRLSTMLQNGRHVADIAVLYPIDALENEYVFNDMGGFYDHAMIPAENNYVAIGDYLTADLRLDFTYLHPSVLNERVSIKDKQLHLDNKTNYEDYKVMILPGMEVISLDNLKKVYEFYQKGGAVISVGMLPNKGISAVEDAEVQRIVMEMFGSLTPSSVEKTNEAGGKVIHVNQPSQLKSALNKLDMLFDVSIDSVRAVNGSFAYIHKVLDNRNIWYFANSSDAKSTTTVTLRGEYPALELWDPMTGEKKALEGTVKDGTTTFALSLEKVSSAFVVEVVK